MPAHFFGPDAMKLGSAAARPILLIVAAGFVLRAEFPIAALTDRVPNGQTTLVFEDKLERRDHPPIVRRLTIMGTVKHGLPTSTDDEVLVGLIQLTNRRSNFTNAKVPFSRYELIELLGWPQSGASYRRIEEALNRWVGVVLMYENAWWDNTAKSWVDENFHVLDNVTLYDRERRKRAGGKSGKPGAKAATRQATPPLADPPAHVALIDFAGFARRAEPGPGKWLASKSSLDWRAVRSGLPRSGWRPKSTSADWR